MRGAHAAQKFSNQRRYPPIETGARLGDHWHNRRVPTGQPMKRLEIFRGGRQTASDGQALEFGEDQIRATVAAYDPTLHEAPIVVGHPRDNHPAYGWVSGLTCGEDGRLQADVAQIEPQFAEMVQAGRFKKRSASFYRPDSPSNPVPGVYYLRHVGFLGAQPPAVKGLTDPEFHDSDADIVEFSETATVAGLFKNLRDFFIERFGREDTDRTLPSWLIEDLDDAARREREAAAPAATSFSEATPPADAAAPQDPPGDTPPPDPDDEDSPMTDADAQALRERAETAETQLQAYKAKETNFAEREAKLRRAELADQIDALVKEGRVLPANREATIDYAATLDDSTELEFAEGDGQARRTQLGRYLDLLGKQPQAVDYAEHSAGTGPGDETIDYAEQSERAQAWKETRRRDGIHISTAQAIRDIQAGRDK